MELLSKVILSTGLHSFTAKSSLSWPFFKYMDATYPLHGVHPGVDFLLQIQYYKDGNISNYKITGISNHHKQFKLLWLN